MKQILQEFRLIVFCICRMIILLRFRFFRWCPKSDILNQRIRAR